MKSKVTMHPVLTSV